MAWYRLDCRMECCADTEFVPEAPVVGGVDMLALERILVANKGRVKIIGAFTAASNVTGATVDTDAVTKLLHQHGAVAIWDYAAAAPHMDIGKRSLRSHGFDGGFILCCFRWLVQT
jgi:selenocysteine lyase/cysteine desulfurase